MKTHIITLLILFLSTSFATSQNINDLINQVNLDTLSLKLQEFTGEILTEVNGTTVTILNRESSNNDLAADYIKQEFRQLSNLSITDQIYSSNGQNVIATQLGKTNPDNIYIICAHYDSVADYCADDNASGTIAVLEIARILSTQCFDNTIIYALWDQEENGLVGSNFYANEAAATNKNILGVLNIDMMGYDGDGDGDFDIDVRDIASSIAMTDDIISVLNTPEYGFNLNVNVVNPGTLASDHSRFWNQGYSAVLVGEAWSNNDQTPFYHSSNDRYNTLDLPYYHQMAKIILAYMATKAALVDIDNSVIMDGSSLMANEASGSYQWFNCTTETSLSGATSQTYTPTSNGDYAVEITIGNCTERSNCFTFDTLGLDVFTENELHIFPNPVKSQLTIQNLSNNAISISIYDISGKLVLTKSIKEVENFIEFKDFSQGVYFVKVKSAHKSGTYKIVKE